jgi:hypothetical protein
MMRGRGDWHKWKGRVERQRLAFRDSERRSLVLVPTEKRLAQVESGFATGSYVVFGSSFLAVGKQNGQLLKAGRTEKLTGIS